MTEYWPNCRDIGGVLHAKLLSQKGDRVGLGVVSQWGS